MIRFVTISVCVLLAAALADASETNAPIPATTVAVCPEFTLLDQFGTRHEFKFPRTKPTVLAVADKKGSEQIEGWAHPLAEQFGEQIDIPGLADVSAVPRPLRGMVQSKFKKAMTQPVMLDWEGRISSGFKYTKGQANVYLIAPDGRVLHHLAGKAEAGKLADLAARIEALLKDSQPAQASARSN
jgi:cytochrome oxidase Cu insertion factor (SCO1/SenC/PrrC family)